MLQGQLHAAWKADLVCKAVQSRSGGDGTIGIQSAPPLRLLSVQDLHDALRLRQHLIM